MKLFNKRAGKKGMLDDLFDLVVTVTISFFLLLFVNATLINTIEQSNTASLREAADTNRILSAITNLRVQVNGGSPLNPAEIETKITQSKVLGGKVITDCSNYYTPEDCENDIVGLYAQSAGSCRWSEAQKICQFMPEVIS